MHWDLISVRMKSSCHWNELNLCYIDHCWIQMALQNQPEKVKKTRSISRHPKNGLKITRNDSMLWLKESLHDQVTQEYRGTFRSPMRGQMKLVDWMIVDKFTWEGKTSVQLLSCKDRKAGWTVLDCSQIPWLGPVFDAVPDTFPRIVDGSKRLNHLNQVEPKANSNNKPYLLSTKFWVWTIRKTRKGWRAWKDSEVSSSFGFQSD